MASVNTSSVREKLDRLKSEFKRQSFEQSLTSETRLLMSSTLTLLELICAIFLEKSNTKNSKNFSKPSSQTEKDETALGRCDRNAGRPAPLAQVPACTTYALNCYFRFWRQSVLMGSHVILE